MTANATLTPLPALSSDIFHRCVEASNEAMMITDLAGRLAYVNPAWCRIYGYAREDAIGRTPRMLHSGSHDKDFYQRMWAQILDPAVGSWRGEVVNRTRSGAAVPVLLTIAPLREGDRITGYMGIAVDIRELKDLQQKVLQQDRLASVGLLASGLAHEVGTPLGVARGRAELIQMRVAGDPAAAASVRTIVDQIDRISKLIKALLRFSRARDAAQDELRPVPLLPVLREVEALADHMLRDAGVELRLEVPPDLQVLGEDQRLQQVFLNLVINAVHAIEEAATRRSCQTRVIQIAAEAPRAPTDRPAVDVVVRDTGCGIAPDDLARIFQPFFTTKEVGKGTGLGLAIVSKLLDEMGGHVRVQSVVNAGSAFHVQLPLAR